MATTTELINLLRNDHVKGDAVQVQDYLLVNYAIGIDEKKAKLIAKALD